MYKSDFRELGYNVNFFSEIDPPKYWLDGKARPSSFIHSFIAIMNVSTYGAHVLTLAMMLNAVPGGKHQQGLGLLIWFNLNTSMDK